jgi:hypothetical protein
LLKVYNATRHWQSNQREAWLELGIEFVPDMSPGTDSVSPNASAEEISREVMATMQRVVASGAEAVLTGGITSFSTLISIRAALLGLAVIEPAVSGKDRKGDPVITGVRDITDILVDHLTGRKITTEGDDDADADGGTRRTRVAP